MSLEEKTEEGEKPKGTKLFSRPIPSGEISRMSSYRPVELCKYLYELRIFRETSRPKIPLCGYSLGY